MDVYIHFFADFGTPCGAVFSGSLSLPSLFSNSFKGIDKYFSYCLADNHRYVSGG